MNNNDNPISGLAQPIIEGAPFMLYCNVCKTKSRVVNSYADSMSTGVISHCESCGNVVREMSVEMKQALLKSIIKLREKEENMLKEMIEQQKWMRENIPIFSEGDENE